MGIRVQRLIKHNVLNGKHVRDLTVLWYTVYNNVCNYYIKNNSSTNVLNYPHDYVEMYLPTHLSRILKSL